MSQKRETQFPHLASSKKQRTTGPDQIRPALKKIAKCIGVASKFEKALELVLELLQKGHVSASHSEALFEVVAIAMLDKTMTQQVKFRKGFCKLISAVVKIANLFTESQKQQIEVYQIWTLCRNELLTDDSFAFGKNMNKFKQLVLELPVSSKEDDEILSQWTQKMELAKKQYQKKKQSGDEDSTQGVSLSWTESECFSARREALIDWLEAAKEPYMKHQWTCSAVDLAIEVLSKNRDKFCKAHQTRITELLKFSKDQKLRRQQGPSLKEKRRDSSIFEETRKEWSKAQVSNRGMVGGEGDHRTEAWLG